MHVLAWIVGSGVIMSAVSLVGGVTLVLQDRTLKLITLPLVAFSAGSLLGGAFFHMLPAALGARTEQTSPFVWVLFGFATFFVLEQFLHWHHCSRAEADCRKPLTYLILVGDGLHNFIGGLAVSGTFLIDIRVGIAAFLAALAHELPQELGDFGVLIHGGWGKTKALTFNLISSSTFLLGGVVTYVASSQIDVGFLVPYAAGNFIYIAASDLVPEVNKHHTLGRDIAHFGAFVAGILLLFLIRIALH